MTKEDKGLLLKDLCARLPYSTLCYCKWTKDAPNGTSGCIQEVSTYLLEELMIIDDQNYECQICEIKPYLRPMSSMTEEECRELTEMTITSPNLETAAVLFRERHYEEEPHWRNDWAICSLPKVLNWLNAHHFDYRNLIGKGLAIEAPEGMYKFN